MADPTSQGYAQRRRAAVAEATERELSALRRRLEEAEAELAELPTYREHEREVERLQQRLVRREEELEQAFADLLAARDDADLQRRELDAAREEVAHLAGVLEQVLGSPSWRLTAPLRKAKERLGR